MVTVEAANVLYTCDKSLLLIMKAKHNIMIAIVLLALLCAARVSAQGVTSEGKEFWIGFMPNYITPAKTLSLYVASGTSNKVLIEQFGDNGQIVQRTSVDLRENEAKTVLLNVALAETRDRETPVHKAIRVTAKAPIALYAMSNGDATADGYLALPTTAYGKKYYAFSYYDDAYSPGSDHLGGEMMIIAPYDNTRVKISTTATTCLDGDGRVIGHEAGQSWTVTLQRGQTYLVQTTGWNWGTDDLTGSSVESDKPVAFLTGHQRASVELGAANNSKDHLIEMLPPVEKWGTEYFEMPMNGRPLCGDYIRVVSAQDNNRISVNGSLKQLNAGEYFEVSQSLVPTVFRSINRKKFMVMSYNYTEGAFGDTGPGDPDIITMTPKEQFQKKIVFRTPSNAGGTAFRHYATFICTKEGISKIILKAGKNEPKALSGFGAAGTANFPGTDYVAVRVQLTGDEITYVAEGPERFGVYMYGYTSVESYGWPAGMALRTESNDPVAPLEAARLEDCGDYEVTLQELHRMPQDTFDDTHIAEISLIEESGDKRWYRSSVNYAFEIDPQFNVSDSVAKFKLRVLDRSKDAYAAIYAIDFAENDTVYEYFYSAPKFSVDPKPDYDFGALLIGSDSCITVTLRNDQPTLLRIQDIGVLGLAKGGKFSITSSIDQQSIAAGDSLKFQLCYAALDTVIAIDSLVITSSCARLAFALRGEGVIPKIYAEDHDFGSVDTGESKCSKIRIYNRGKYPLEIGAHDLTTGNPDFALEAGQSFPIVISPGSYALVGFCFTPSRLGEHIIDISYATNIPEPFKELDKDHSRLVGISQVPGAKLTVLNKYFGAVNCIERPRYVDTLYNDQEEAALVERVEIIGPGKASYKIVQSIPANRIQGFVLDPQTDKSGGIQYVVEFDPNVAGTTIEPQLAQLVAVTSAGVQPITNLSGHRMAPVLQLQGANVRDLGTVMVGTEVTEKLVIQNTGSDVLNVDDILATNGDIASFAISPKRFSVSPGELQEITVVARAGNEPRLYSCELEIQVLQPSCAQNQIVKLTLMATNTNYTAQGANYNEVFTCLDKTLSGQFTNLSSHESLVITEVAVVNTSDWLNASDFELVTELTNPVSLLPMESYTVPVKFIPSSQAVLKAGLRFTFVIRDSTKQVIVPLSGIGKVIPQVIAAGDLGGGVVYKALANSAVTIPVKAAASLAGADAAVRGYSFDMSFMGDALHFDESVIGPGNVQLTSTLVSRDATGRETWRISTAQLSNTDILITENAAEVTVYARVSGAATSTTQLEVANALWLDSMGSSICYMPTTYVPATLILDPQCGDEAMQGFLDGKSIKDLTVKSISYDPTVDLVELRFELHGETSNIDVRVYDLLGRELSHVGDMLKQAGTHLVKLNTSKYAEGMYYVKVSNGRSVQSKALKITK